MSYLDAFSKIKTAMERANAKSIQGHFALQINLTDEDSNGIFYIEGKDGNLYIEPYDYYDRDAILYVTAHDFLQIVTGKLSYDRAVNDGRLTIDGNAEKASVLKSLIAKASPKRASSSRGNTAKGKTTGASKKNGKVRSAAQAVFDSKESGSTDSLDAKQISAERESVSEQ